jgi:hypothetical protein
LTVRYTIEAKPTFYNGVQFRSRLEAKWAAYFDLEGWKWWYEPIDLGNWSPDFLIKLEPSDDGCYIEVKPIRKFDRDTAIKMLISTAPRVALFGLDNESCWWWSKYDGEFLDFSLISGEGEMWKQACNTVQWRCS